ncbi:MAG TPA: hypothetical protein VFB42_10725 [Gaiellaceae bacterium]|nr:hypothetical protein [Gaiellaceae bacterium]
MSRPGFRVALLVAALGLVGAAAALASRPLRTADLPAEVSPAQIGPALHRIAGLGATSVVLPLSWKGVAPDHAPSDPTDPGSSGYDWSAYDGRVQAAAAEGLSVVGLLESAPSWALVPASPGGEPTLPDPGALADFAAAAATRYSGSYLSLPRVGAWAVWNEPNISLGLVPQFVGGTPFSPGWYRSMVNGVYDAVKAVDPAMLVVAGETAPYFDNGVTDVDSDWGPLSFMRKLLCLSDDLQSTCATATKFDVWATHPYVEGGPRHHASLPNDVSVADLAKMRGLIEAAIAAGHVVSSQDVELWATEFSWDSNPPDPRGVPVTTLARWVPEALYRMWQGGVSLVAWYTLGDLPLSYRNQSGLLYENGSEKAYAQAFAFPVVGINHRDQLEVWGRTPGGAQATVTIQRSTGGAWTYLGTVSSDADGIFQARFSAEPSGSIRALAPSLGAQSAEYPLGPDPDVNAVYPQFGEVMLEPASTRVRAAIPAPPAGGSSVRIAVEQRLRAGQAP